MSLRGRSPAGAGAGTAGALVTPGLVPRRRRWSAGRSGGVGDGVGRPGRDRSLDGALRVVEDWAFASPGRPGEGRRRGGAGQRPRRVARAVGAASLAPAGRSRSPATAGSRLAHGRQGSGAEPGRRPRRYPFFVFFVFRLTASRMLPLRRRETLRAARPRARAPSSRPVRLPPGPVARSRTGAPSPRPVRPPPGP